MQCGRPEFNPWGGKIPWRREMLPTPVFWPGGFHGLYSPWGCKEWDTTFTFFLSTKTMLSQLTEESNPFQKLQSFSSVQSLTCVRLFATPWTAAHQASLSITNSWSLLKLMSIESVMPSSHLILCRPLLILPPIPPSIRVFPVSQHFAWGGQSIRV